MIEIPWERIREECEPASTDYSGPLMCLIADMINAKATMEIGVGMGYVSIGLGIFAKSNEGTHYCVDIDEDRCLGLKKKAREFNSRCVVICGNSKLVEFKGKLDLLFVDGSHTAGVVISDLNNFGSQVRKGGVIGCHDYYRYRASVGKGCDEWFREQKGEWDRLRIPGAKKTRDSIALFRREK